MYIGMMTTVRESAMVVIDEPTKGREWIHVASFTFVTNTLIRIFICIPDGGADAAFYMPFQGVPMSVIDFHEGNEKTHEPSRSVMNQEEFEEVFGVAVPACAPWVGLMFV